MAKPFLIDSHTHINFSLYKEDGQQVIERTLKENVWLVLVGAQHSTSRRAVEYAQKYKEGVYAAVGLHPSHVHRDNLEQDKGAQEESRQLEEFEPAKYQELLANPKTVAVGEIGLDYNEQTSQEAKDRQKQVLLEQLELAQQMDKPVIFHCRKAYDDLIELLSQFQAGCLGCPFACPGADSPQFKGVFHCFMGR